MNWLLVYYGVNVIFARDKVVGFLNLGMQSPIDTRQAPEAVLSDCRCTTHLSQGQNILNIFKKRFLLPRVTISDNAYS